MLPKRVVGFPSSLHCARIDGSNRRDRVHGQALHQTRRLSAKPTLGAGGFSGRWLQFIAIAGDRPDRITHLFAESNRNHTSWTMRRTPRRFSVATGLYPPHCETVMQRARLPIRFAGRSSRSEAAKQICVGNKKSRQVRRDYSYTLADTCACR